MSYYQATYLKTLILFWRDRKDVERTNHFSRLLASQTGEVYSCGQFVKV
jgi:hypothetical protein